MYIQSTPINLWTCVNKPIDAARMLRYTYTSLISRDSNVLLRVRVCVYNDLPTISTTSFKSRWANTAFELRARAHHLMCSTPDSAHTNTHISRFGANCLLRNQLLATWNKTLLLLAFLNGPSDFFTGRVFFFFLDFTAAAIS